MKMKMIRALALAMAALMAASFAACGKTDAPETTAAANDAETSIAQVADIETNEALDTELTVRDGETTAEAVVMETPTEAATADATTTTAADTTTTTQAETTTAAAKAPTDKAEILKLYNDATARVASKKVAFHKERATKEGVYEAGVALKTFKGLVYQFMGIGSDNKFTKDVEKNNEKYERFFQKSTLTASDIKDATCTLNDKGGYDIVIKIKDGSSSIEGGKNESISAPLDKSAIASGRDDKGEWDHKTAQNVYDAIDDVASGSVIKEKYTNATIKTTVDKNGNITKMDTTFDIEFDISKVYGASGHATGTTTINCSGFKW